MGDVVASVACMALIVSWCYFDIKLQSRQALFGLSLKEARSPKICTEVREYLRGAYLRSLLWPVAVTGSLLIPLLLSDTLQSVVVAIAPHFYSEVRQRFSGSPLLQTSSLALLVFILIQVPSLGARASETRGR